MTLSARLTMAPRPFDPARGADVLSQLPALEPRVADLIAGTAGCSPFLAGLIVAERDWLLSAFDGPEDAAAAEIAACAGLAPDALPRRLRQAKRRIAVLAALADLGGVWPLEQVTGTLTALADAAVHAALTTAVGAEIARGRLPGLTADDAATGGSMVALAMGKMGAGELNYSSDIDLVCLFDESRFSRDDYPEARAAFIRATRRMTGWLSDLTEDGYVFRTDLRLRPDAAVTPVCMAMAGAEAYYEAEGRTWERAAYIKARAAAGDIAAGARFLRTLTPFVWRKHLDFAAIQDAHDMRLRIRDHKGLHGPLSLPGHDMKLGRGGIREIEFFTQTRQLIAGGRDPALRVRGTVEGLARLAAAGWIPQDAADRLTAHYRAHRMVEHRVQMIHDTQTHALPATEEGFSRLAAFMDMTPDALAANLTARIEEVHDLTEGFFAPGAAPAQTDDWGQEITARWPSYPALKSPRATEIFRRLRPEILRLMKDSARPEEALAEFDGFLAGLPAGVQLFALFDANPQLTRLVVDICATAPALARYLARNAGVFDAVIGGRFFAPWPGAGALAEGLTAALLPVDGYERRLDAARRWTKEWHFRIGVHHLRGLIAAEEAGRQYADLARAVLAALWPVVAEAFATRHGPPPGQGAAVVGMGSLGAGCLNAGSDLDLIVVYDADGADMSDGPRPLAARAYYARLTQALVTALTALTAEGRLYEVDMRLRPSGRQGPVAVSLTAFRDYQMTEAWTWEHLALTRACPLAGAAGVGEAVEAIRAEVLRAKGQGPRVRADVADMRARVTAAKGDAGPFDARHGPGRLFEIDLAAQTCALLAGAPARDTPAQIAAGAAAGLLTGAEAAALTAARARLWRLHAGARLILGATFDPDAVGEGGRRFILRETGVPDLASLATAVAEAATPAARIIDCLLGAPDARP